ncbi:HD domain-containing protein [Trueperella bialowiezensis]|nr:HD domain-containing protein [Trueperella bialowiezensis]
MAPTAASLLPATQELLRAHLEATSAPRPAVRYRFEHSLRVARLGRVVAERSHLDPDMLQLGCLLHDIGKYDAQVPVDHGRAGAVVVNSWFDSQGFHGSAADEIVQGIAMHVDGQFNPRTDGEGTDRAASGEPYLTFTRNPGPVATSIGDCDNLDRFSAYRIADTLHYVRFMDKSTAEQREFIKDYLFNLSGLYDYECTTEAAQQMWIDRLDFQQEYFTRLLADVG